MDFKEHLDVDLKETSLSRTLMMAITLACVCYECMWAGTYLYAHMYIHACIHLHHIHKLMCASECIVSWLIQDG